MTFLGHKHSRWRVKERTTSCTLEWFDCWNLQEVIRCKCFRSETSLARRFPFSSKLLLLALRSVPKLDWWLCVKLFLDTFLILFFFLTSACIIRKIPDTHADLTAICLFHRIPMITVSTRFFQEKILWMQEENSTLPLLSTIDPPSTAIKRRVPDSYHSMASFWSFPFSLMHCNWWWEGHSRLSHVDALFNLEVRNPR